MKKARKRKRKVKNKKGDKQKKSEKSEKRWFIVTVKGDDIIRNCRECFSKHGYGIRLREHAFKKGVFECPQCAANYVIDNGTLVKA